MVCKIRLNKAMTKQAKNGHKFRGREKEKGKRLVLEREREIGEKKQQQKRIWGNVCFKGREN